MSKGSKRRPENRKNVSKRWGQVKWKSERRLTYKELGIRPIKGIKDGYEMPYYEDA